MIKNSDKSYLRKIYAERDYKKYIIGKNNLDDNTLDMLNKALEKNELIKISYLKTSDVAIKSIEELVKNLSSLLKAEIVQVVGHTAILYRANPKAKNRIILK